jgi:hypothetical protein
MPTAAFKSMLANNKNFFLQNDMNRKIQIQRQLPNYIGGGVEGATTGNWGKMAGQVYNDAINYEQNKLNEKFTVDNLKSAPGQIIGARGSAIFEHMYSENGVIVEEYDILPNEKEIINDFMCKFGFTVNRFGNPKDYDNIRHYYNYVKAKIDSISGMPLSNAARDDIRQRFANGIRFWKQDNIDYSMENYEEWLKGTIIQWEIQPDEENLTVEYNGKIYNDIFTTKSNDTIKFLCSSNASIEITNVEIDGFGNITKPNSYTAILTYENATYVKVYVKISRDT